MIRILIATALLIAAFTVSAMADDTASVDVGVEVEAYCFVTFTDGTANDDITVDTIAELEGLAAESDDPSDDELDYGSTGTWTLTFDDADVNGRQLSVFINNVEYVDGATIDSDTGGGYLNAEIDKYRVEFDTEPTVGSYAETALFTMTCN